jgi:hypothetical protein
MHADDAVVRYPEGLGTAAGIDRSDFAQAHREISLRHRDILPQIGTPMPLRMLPTNDAAETVAWFEVTEERERRKLVAALGVRIVDGLPRIGWATLAAVRLSPGVPIPWENFRDIEKSLCDVLMATDVPMRRRLHVGSRLLGALRDKATVDTNRWLAEPAEEITTELRTAIHEMLMKILGWDRAVLKELPQAIPAALFEMEVRDPMVLARILQNTLFCKTYSYSFDLTTAYNFLIVLYLLTLIMQEAASGPLSDPIWRELGSLGVHGLLKSVLHDGVPEGFRTVFGTAEFGLWMLRA